MAARSTTPSPLADADIFLRLWERQKLTPALARHLLRLGFSRAIWPTTARGRGGRLGSASPGWHCRCNTCHPPGRGTAAHGASGR